MAWKFHNETPIYLQIMDVIKLWIIQGKLKAGDKVPSVRELAMEAGVNPNTMQKALSELEREGVLYSQRTAGRFVADKNQEMSSVREEISRKHLFSFVNGMRELCFKDEEIVEKLKDYLKSGLPDVIEENLEIKEG